MSIEKPVGECKHHCQPLPYWFTWLAIKENLRVVEYVIAGIADTIHVTISLIRI